MYDSKAVRTKASPVLVRDRIVAAGMKKELADVAMKIVAIKFGYNSENEELTKQVLAFSEGELDVIAEGLMKILDGKTAKEAEEMYIGEKNKKPTLTPACTDEMKKICEEARKIPNCLSLALSGRMDATKTLEEIEAATYFGFQISTNPYVLYNDFFIALDDIIKNGAGMMDYSQFTSPCMYNHTVLDPKQLKINLAGYNDVDEFIKVFIPKFVEAVAETVPSAKKHMTDSEQLPGAVLVEVAETQTSYVNGFAKPIRGENLLERSVQKLAETCNIMNEKWNIECKKRIWYNALPSRDKITVDCATNVNKFEELLEELKKAL